MALYLCARLCFFAVILLSLLGGVKGGDANTFLELATERFEARVGRPATPEELTWTFDKIQFLRVPKAGSTSASVLARRLVGCYPRGPCCGKGKRHEIECPSQHADCGAVIGCHNHDAPDKTLLEDPSIFSMANLRDIVDRIESEFFYNRYPGLPCHKKNGASPKNYLECFLATIITPEIRNVASRMFTGRGAHDSEVICINKADSKKCTEDLQSTIYGVCKLNFILIEMWSTSVMLLFETLPWVAPSEDFFPIPSQNSGNSLPATVNVRKNTDKNHDEGIQHITQTMREMASEANAVDGELYQFVLARFCDRLNEADLLEHPLVMDELERFYSIYERCTNSSWISETVKRFAPLVTEDCRLYKPLAKPAR